MFCAPYLFSKIVMLSLSDMAGGNTLESLDRGIKNGADIELEEDSAVIRDGVEESTA